MYESIIEILQDLNPEVDYDQCTNLVTGRYIDSLMMLSLVSELEDTFDIEIPAVDIIARNFDSVEDIAALIAQLRGEELG